MSDGDINLAALWVPVMAETSKVKEQLREAGSVGGREFSDALGRAIDPNVFQRKLLQSIQSDAIRQGIKDFKNQLEPDPTRFAGIGAGMGEGLLEGFQRTGAMEKLSGLFGGLNLGTLGVAAGVTGIVVAADRLVEKLMDVGEQFEGIERQIRVMSNASGEAFEGLKSHADNLVSSLDVPIKTLGTDMAMLATRLKAEPGAALDELTKHVEELRDRFGQLDTSTLAGAFVQFGISIDQSDETLASLVGTSREYGVQLNTILEGLAKAGPTFTEFHMNIEQAGHMLGLLESAHLNAADAVTLLSRAEKANKDTGKDLTQFIQDEITIINQYAAAGNDAAADQEAFLAFGIKNWPLAIKGASAYLETIKAGPDAYKKSTSDTEDFIEKSEDLGNKWTKVWNNIKQVAEFDLGGSQLVHGMSEMLDEINSALNDLGLLHHSFGPPGTPATGSTHGFKPPAPASLPPGRGTTGVPAPVPAPPGAPAGRAPVPGVTSLIPGFAQVSPGAPTLPGTSIPLPGVTAAPSAFGGVKLSDFSTPLPPSGDDGGIQSWLYKQLMGSGLSSDEAKGILAMNFVEGGATSVKSLLGFTESQAQGAQGHLQAFLKQWNDMSRRGPGGEIPGVGTGGMVTDWNAYMTWIRERIVGQTGASRDWQGNQQPAATDYQSRLMSALGQSGGAPSSGGGGDWWRGSGNANLPGASGIQQVIFSNRMTGQKTGEAGPQSGGGGLPGQLVGPGTNQPQYYSADWEGHTGHVHTSFTKSPTTGEPYGLPPGTNISQGGPGFPAWVYDLGAKYGLIASTYSGHQVLADGLQHGIDWWPAAGGNMTGAGYTQSQESDLQNFATSMATAGAGGGTGGAGDRTFLADWSGGGGGGASPQGGGGFSRGGGRGGPRPIDPNKLDELLLQRQRSLEDANDRVADANAATDNLTEQEKETATAALQARQALTGLIPGSLEYADAMKAVTKAEKAHETVVRELHHATEERRRAGEDLQIAQDKSREPLTKGGGSNEYGSMAQQLGSGFLKGIGQELGFGDVFKGKPPWEWGIFKLFTGLAGWGLGEANALGDARGGIPGALGDAGGGIPGLGGPGANAVLGGLAGAIPGVKDFLPRGIKSGNVPLGPSPAGGALAPAPSMAAQPSGYSGDANTAGGPTFYISQQGMFLDQPQATNQIRDAAYTGTAWHSSMTTPSLTG